MMLIISTLLYITWSEEKKNQMSWYCDKDNENLSICMTSTIMNNGQLIIIHEKSVQCMTLYGQER